MIKQLKKLLKKYANSILIILIILSVGFILYYSRQIFYYTYEPEYYENWYYHSQWNIPQSTRGISDGELYKFVGYQLANGENHFYLNYQIPPFAKYLYGLAEKYLKNPYWVNILLYLLATNFLYKLTRLITNNKTTSLLATLLFTTTAFVATQIRETMLDLPLMTLYLGHTYYFIKYIKHKKITPLILSGIFVGLAAGTKPPIYIPAIIILSSSFILIKSRKKIFDIITYAFSNISGYALAFTSYFLHHPNPIPWIKLHRKAIDFYLAPESNIDYLNQWRSIFLNTYQGWWQTERITLGDWSPIIPLGVITVIIIFLYSIKNRQLETAYLSLLTTIFLITNTFIPFWPRYLMPLVPLFIILITLVSKKFKIILVILILLNLPSLIHSFSNPNPQGDAQASARFISTRAYRELYRSIDPQQRQNLPEHQFINTLENLYTKLGVKKIVVTTNETQNNSENIQNVQFNITYLTKYGPINHQPIVTFSKINNQWKTIWSWEYILPQYQSQDQLIINENDIPFKELNDPRGNTLAIRSDWHTVYIIPRLMHNWNQSLNAVSQATNQNTNTVNQIIRSVIPDQYPRYVGYLNFNTPISEVEAIPGATIQNIQYAKPTQIKTTINIPEQLNQLQQEQPELFYIPSEIYLQKPDGRKTLIHYTLDQTADIVAIVTQ